MSDCIGITKARKICNSKLLDDNITGFCKRHEQQINIPKDKLLEILKGIENFYKACSRCDNWHNFDTKLCQPCIIKNQNLRNKNKNPKCDAFINPEKTKTGTGIFDQ